LLSNEFFPLRIHQNRFRLGLCLRPHWESLQCSPDLLAGFKGAALRQEGNGAKEGREERKGKGGMGKGGEKGEVGGIAPWLLGG